MTTCKECGREIRFGPPWRWTKERGREVIDGPWSWQGQFGDANCYLLEDGKRVMISGDPHAIAVPHVPEDDDRPFLCLCYGEPLMTSNPCPRANFQRVEQ